MFLSAAISTLTNKATDVLLTEFTSSLGIEQHRQDLCRILLALQGIVADAEERSEADPAVREWLHYLNVVVHEVEDVLDNLKCDAISKALGTKIRPEQIVRPFRTIPVYSSLVWGGVRSVPAGTQLKGVLEKIEAIVEKMNQFGFLVANETVSTVHTNWPRSHLYVLESAVIGRSDDLENIVAAVLSESKAVREHSAVFSIVGMCGSGKTTLSQLVYDDVRIQNHFQMKLTVCGSGDFNVSHLAKRITISAIGFDNPLPITNVKVIRSNLHEALNGKRYLLILEDVLNEKRVKWVQLKFLLDCGRPGSVIIVTTRNEIVSNVVEAISTHTIKGLNGDHLWTIFRQRAFGLGVTERPELVVIGKQLIDKCRRSPLLATILGAMLSYKQEEREWLDVLESNIWKNSDVDNEFTVLKLSYSHLPSYMKQCFAFCVIFPKGTEIERDTLIQLWMANEFIPSDGNMDIGAKGIEIFNELAWRGFFQHVKKERKKLIFLGFISQIVCRMHDLIHDFAQSIVGTEYDTLLNLEQQNNLSNETLHVSTCYKQGLVSVMERCSSVRTLLDFGYATDHNEGIIHWQKQSGQLDFSMPNSLRALSLHCASISCINAIPGILKHLRYLDLSGCCFLMELSESFCTLHNLQTLNLTDCRDLTCLPEGMWRMRSLRYLYLDGCFSLQDPPPSLSNVICLFPVDPYGDSETEYGSIIEGLQRL